MPLRFPGTKALVVGMVIADCLLRVFCVLSCHLVLSYRHYDLSTLEAAVASFDLSSRLIVEAKTRDAWSAVVLWTRSTRIRDMCKFLEAKCQKMENDSFTLMA